MLIDGLLSDGLAVLAGDSNIGKSWMVLWLCLQLSRGEPVWGLPVRKTDVIYLALEDNEWRIQQRMQELTDIPPDNLHFGFSCGRLGAELEAQIEGVLSEHPGTGVVFIDTLQMIRDNATVRSNVYAQDYKELSSLKKLADRHGICIFIVHHTRKERDRDNIFNDLTGSTGIMGVADTVMVLRKANRFGSGATLYVTGRDIEEQRLELDLRGVHWEVVQALDAESIQKERIPDFLYRVADYLMDNGHFEGTVSELLAVVGNTELKPNMASKYLTRYFSEVLAPLGVKLTQRKTASARILEMTMNDADDDACGSKLQPSRMTRSDDKPLLSAQPSLPSQPSWEEVEQTDELPFRTGVSQSSKQGLRVPKSERI